MLLILAACGGEEPVAEPVVEPTVAVAPTADLPDAIEADSELLVIATDAPLPPYSDFDAFGNVVGFNAAVMEAIAAEAGLDHEWVVTPSDGVLQSIAAGSARDFDAVMSASVSYTHLTLPTSDLV